MDLPVQFDIYPFDVPYQCLVAASRDYSVPESVLLAIRKTEGGSVGRYSQNTNQTKDYGPYQINDVWVEQFRKKEGITKERLMNDICLSVRAAAYIVRTEIDRSGGNFWLGVGRYHSRTPSLRDAYVAKVYPKAVSLQQWLEGFAQKRRR